MNSSVPHAEHWQDHTADPPVVEEQNSDDQDSSDADDSDDAE